MFFNFILWLIKQIKRFCFLYLVHCPKFEIFKHCVGVNGCSPAVIASSEKRSDNKSFKKKLYQNSYEPLMAGILNKFRLNFNNNFKASIYLQLQWYFLFYNSFCYSKFFSCHQPKLALLRRLGLKYLKKNMDKESSKLKLVSLLITWCIQSYILFDASPFISLKVLRLIESPSTIARTITCQIAKWFFMFNS